MADLTPYKDQIDRARQQLRATESYEDPRPTFLDHLHAEGFKPPASLDIGIIKRFAAPGDKGQKKSGWAIYYEIDDENHPGRVIGIAAYEDWKSGSLQPRTWCSRSMSAMTAQQRISYQNQIEAIRIARDIEQRAIHEAKAAQAHEIWNASAAATVEHPYLKRKAVIPYDGVRVSRGDLVIPITADGHLTSLQFIKADGVFEHTGNNKAMMGGGRKKGCYFKIDGRDTGTVYICEGYATGASLAMASDAIVYIAFDAGNLFETALHAKSAHSQAKIIVAGDDDTKNEVNAGRAKATQAAEGLGIAALFPPASYKDFNDYHVAHGLDALRAHLTPRNDIYRVKPVTAQDAEYLHPPGILGEIVDYYNATAGNRQPLYAIQTAIAIASVACARNFETNLGNRTSLFLMNIGKSGTGKEHPKTVMELVLGAANKGNLISGDGYTSASAVISALQERVRHITTIDEFSKYLQAANNKYGNSHLMEANAQLMQAFGRLSGTMRPRAYATIGLNKDKKKELADMKILNPAITLLSMTTPDDLFKNIDISSVKDGFLNRFIICVSDAERTLREHKEALEVPQSIIDWFAHIDARCGTVIENALDMPQIVQLNFTTEAMDAQREFQQYCLDKANSLESMGMSEMPGRANEISMRLALICALAQNPNANIVTIENMHWAIHWVKTNMVYVVDRLKMSLASSQHEAEKKEILGAIRAAGEDGVTWPIMQKRAPFAKYKRKDLQEILTALKDGDLIDEAAHNSGGRGRPTTIYRALA